MATSRANMNGLSGWFFLSRYCRQSRHLLREDSTFRGSDKTQRSENTHSRVRERSLPSGGLTEHNGLKIHTAESERGLYLKGF